MKRIYLLMILFVAFAGNAIAHRTSDIKVTLAKPTSSTILTAGGSFDIDAIIQNLGPDSIRSATDSIQWFATIQNGLINFTIGSQSGTIWLRYNTRMNTNDTFHVRFNGLTPTNYTGVADSQRTLCFYAVPMGPNSDTIRDPNLNPIASSNNRACATFTWKKTVGVNDVQGGGTNNVKIFPNPAKGEANISFENNSPADVTLAILDLTGRKVASVNKGIMGTGNHTLQFSTAHLAPGIYVYELTVGNDMTAARFTVQ